MATSSTDWDERALTRGRGATVVPRVPGVHAVLAAPLVARPDATALVSIGPDGSTRSLTYRELEAEVAGRAASLAGSGVAVGQRVGVVAARGHELVPTVLAVLRCGASYVPLDPRAPDDRWCTVLDLAGTGDVVGPAAELERRRAAVHHAIAWDWPVDVPVDVPPAEVDPASEAYLLFTSGSTGVPKGVSVSHANVVARLESFAPHHDPPHVSLLHTSLCFDAALVSLLPVLASGGTVVVAPDAAAEDPTVAARLIADHSVSFVAGVPSWYAALLELAPEGSLRSLRRVVNGGEAMPPALVATHQRSLPHVQLVNEYGPTEATVAACAFEVPDGWAGASVPVGRAYANTVLYVVDAEGRPAAVGETGELWIGGDGVALGYVGASDDGAFCDDPSGVGRAYRTGDMARWNVDGDIELLGRADRQVKIGGVRVEPDETEAHLLGLPGVALAAVEVDRSAPGARLVAYASAHPGVELVADEIAARLAAVLPPAQVPSEVVVLERLPTTVGGKVDRRSLPLPDRSSDGEPPRTPEESAVCAAVAEVLGLASVGRDLDVYAAGGDSLSAARVVARLRQRMGRDVAPGDLRDHPTPAALAALLTERAPLADAGADGVPTPVPRNADGSWRGPAGDSATSFWYLEQEEGRAGGSNLVEVLRLGDHVEPAVVEQALAVLVDRHAGLRTAFELGSAGLEQVVHPRGSVALRVDLIDDLLPHDGLVPHDGDLDAVALRVGTEPFDLSRPPLARVGLAHEPGATSVVLVVHHAVADGWAMETLIEELVALIDEPGRALPPVELDAVDVVAWIEERLDRDDEAVATFAGRLAEGAELRGRLLPYDHRPQRDRGHAAGAVRTHLSAGTTKGLTSTARHAGASVFSALVATLGVVLRRFGAPDELLVGVATANRPLPELEPVVGCLTNFVPLRVDMRGDITTGELLRRVYTDVEDSAGWGWVPVEAALGRRGTGSALALPDVMISMLNYRPDVAAIDRHGVAVPHVLTDLDVVVIQHDGGLDVELHHDPHLLDRSTVERLAAAWTDLLADLAVEGERRVASVAGPRPGDGEEAALVGGVVGPPPDGSVLDLIAPHLDAGGPAPALVDGDVTISWSSLGSRVRHLAGALADEGVGRGARVVVAADRAPAIEALLACWWLGAVPVPVGDRRPADSVAEIAERCAASLVVDAAGIADRVADGAHREVPRAPLDGGELAYVLFTSGSTGTPKGVMVSHRALLASTRARGACYPDAPPVALLSHDMAFDVGTGLSTWYLSRGATIVTMAPEERLDPARMAAVIAERGVGLLDLVPAHHRLLLEHAPPGSLDSVRVVTVGAEACPPSLVALHRRLLPSARLVNEYGPTECTVGTVAHECTDDDADRSSVPIGRPMLHTVARVADAAGRPLPLRAVGELLLSGHLLAEGYLGDPEQTAERFVEVDGDRWYRTGDRARWNVDGELEFLGRLDDQLKVRGYRIEPGEVEATIEAHPAVARAAVDARDLAGDGPVLVAWVAARPGASPVAADLVAHCRRTLPEWMVPAVVSVVDELPLTVTGKIDRRRLADPDGGGHAAERVAPGSPLEQVVVGVWERLLERPVGMTDNFFEVGGHSLLAARLVAEVSAQVGVEVLLPDLLQHATPTHMVQVVEARMASGWARSAHAATITTIRAGRRAPLVIVARDGETSLYLRHVLRSLDEERPLWLALRPMPPLTARRADLVVQGRQVAEALLDVGGGPFHLLGHSASGLVAMEAARILGDQATSVILLDTVRASSTLQLAKHPLHRLRRWFQPTEDDRTERADARAALDALHRGDDTDPHVLRVVRDLQDERGFLRLRGRPYGGPTHLLAAEDSRAALGPDLGWARWCRDLQTHDLPSDHFGILLPPHVDETVAALAQILHDRP